MGLLSILSKGFNAMIDEAITPASFKMGQKFEDYVRQFLFPSNFYDLLHKSHNYNTNKKDYVESSLEPDFKFRDKNTRKDFYVEAKFRTDIYKGKIYWCNEKQLYRYQQYHKIIPVFLILGMGEDPRYPELLSLISLNEARYTGLFSSVVEKFALEFDKPITSVALWKR